MPRTLVANLDVEARWHHLSLPHRPKPHLGTPILERLSAYGTLLRAFAHDDDVLWTPLAVDRGRLPPLLPTPTLLCGEDVRPGAADLFWGREDAVTAQVNHRRFAWEIACRQGIELEGSAWVDSEGELTRRLGAGGALHRWVVKAPLSAAGRDRVVGSGPPGDQDRRRLARLLARSDGLLVEPWLDRLDDFGVLLEIRDGEVQVLSIHRQVIGREGRFQGIEWQAAHSSDATSEILVESAEATGRALRDSGYRGPAGIDAWTWQRPGGPIQVNPLGEINARFSFGWVARELGLRLGLEALRLRLGTAADLAGASDRVLPLLLPDTFGRGAAWIETTA